MPAIAAALDIVPPAEWGASELGEEADLINGSAFRPEDWKTTGVPIVRIQNLKDRNAPFNYFQGDPNSKIPLKNGDLLFSWSGSIGTSFGPHYWWGDIAVLNQHIFRVDIKPKTRVTKPFLYFALLHLTKEIESHAYGLAALVHVRKGDLEATLIPIPPIPEQRKIAAVLGLVQRAIEQQDRLIVLTMELKKALLQKLFTEGLCGEPQKQTEIGPVPESWEITKLGSLVNLQTGKLNSNAGTSNGEFPFFTCSQETFRIDQYAFDTEAILLSGNNAQGVYSVKHYKGKFNAYQRTYVITLKVKGSMPYSFLHHALSRNLERLRSLSIGTSTKYLTLGVLQNLPIPKPKYEEAECIGQQLEVIETKIANAARKKTVLTDLFRTLLYQLMTAQIRVHDLELPPEET
jgi:restriction endonuclease S subunit